MTIQEATERCNWMAAKTGTAPWFFWAEDRDAIRDVVAALDKANLSLVNIRATFCKTHNER